MQQRTDFPIALEEKDSFFLSSEQRMGMLTLNFLKIQIP